MRRHSIAVVIAGMWLALPAPAAAQAEAPKVLITAGLAGQPGRGFTQALTSAIYSEDTVLNGTYKSAGGFRLEVGGAVRVAARVGVGGSISVFRKDIPLHVTASIPHPFFFNQFRPAAGDAQAHRASRDIHADVVYFLVNSRTWVVTVAGGPTFAHLTQQLGTELVLDDPYPHDTVGIKEITLTEVSGNAVGGHVGGSITRMISKSVGVGGEVRFTTATITLKPAGGSVKTKTGGVQAGGGVRIVF